jgi:hypothetical protein
MAGLFPSNRVPTHHWTVDQLAEYLSTGWHKLHGAAAGPMGDVFSLVSVRPFDRWTESDRCFEASIFIRRFM